MEIRKVRVSEINPAPYNPRVDLKPGDPEYEKLKKSMTTFGYVDPIIWNCRTGSVVAGHQRLKILLVQGAKQIEVSVVDLPLEKEKALNVALNKIEGRWDDEKLAGLLDELAQMPDFDVSLTGFDAPEISELLDTYCTSQDEDEFDVEKVVEGIETPVTKKGELIELGPHRILCGDSSSVEALQKLMQGMVAALLFTDPPYNVAYYGGNRPSPDTRPKRSRDWDRIYGDNLSQEQYENWLKGIFANVTPFLDEGAPVYIWNGHKQFGPMHQMLTALGFHVSCVITWVKESFAIGYSDYHQRSEFCLYAWKENSGAHRWYGPTNESTVWEIKRDPTRAYIHPTQKPIALAQRAMRNSSVRDDIVLDLFLGSGSTLIAAESLGRKCFGIEIDPKYCDGIVARYIAYVGKENISDEIRERYLREDSNGNE